MNPRCRGAFVGLNIIHTKAHLLRAIMEGVAYSLADCNNILKNLGIAVDNMKVCGGGSKSPVGGASWQLCVAAISSSWNRKKDLLTELQSWPEWVPGCMMTGMSAKAGQVRTGYGSG